MRKRFGILVVFCTLVLGSLSQVAASTYYGLEWGFEVGDQFHFRRSGTPFFPKVDYYVEIDKIPFNLTIDPFNVTDVNPEDVIADFFGYYTIYYENGTEMTEPQVFIALPIGNWSVFEESFNESFQDFTFFDSFEWIDTETEWGFTETSNFSSNIMTATVTFSKIDGVLNLLRTTVTPEIGIKISVQVARRDVGSGNFPILEVGIVVGIVSIAAIAVAMKSR